MPLVKGGKITTDPLVHVADEADIPGEGAILISAAIYAPLALLSIGQLISIYGWLRGATTGLTVLSAWGLRRKQPDLPRVFRIPGGNLGLLYVIVLPLAMTCVALFNSPQIARLSGPCILAAGPVVYFVVKWFAKRAGQQAAKAE